MANIFIKKPLGELSVFFIGKERCKSGHHFSQMFPDRFLIHYVASGKGIFRSGGREYQLKAGNIFFIGNQYGYYEADIDDPWTYMWINFSGGLAEHFLEQIGLNSQNPVYTSSAPDEISACFERVLSAKEPDNDFIIYGRLFELLGKIIETNAVSITPEKTENQYIRQCIDYIRINYYRNINTKDICAFVGLEYSYLFRLFKSELNTSPGKYLNSYRLSRAAYLLKNTSMAVSDIASAVGYGDRAAFSKAFSRKYGYNPSDCKNGQPH